MTACAVATRLHQGSPAPSHQVLTLIRLEQVRAELCQCSKMFSLVRMLDLTCIQQVVENRSETAQVPEIGVVEFHVGLPVFGQYD